MVDRKAEIEYVNGNKETIDLSCVVQYAFAPNFHSYGTGCDMYYIAQLLQERKSIIIAKNHGNTSEEGIEQVINTNNVLNIRPVGTKGL
ncbi:hypothetical protein KW787_00940 [Candidatus Pacearchaeota archaeon]|nr:hypothetical protein [Candidatus Pacearchaeota archaeon]